MMEEWSAPEAPADQNATGDIWRVLIHNDDRTPFEYVIGRWSLCLCFLRKLRTTSRGRRTTSAGCRVIRPRRGRAWRVWLVDEPRWTATLQFTIEKD